MKTALMAAVVLLLVACGDDSDLQSGREVVPTSDVPTDEAPAGEVPTGAAATEEQPQGPSEGVTTTIGSASDDQAAEEAFLADIAGSPSLEQIGAEAVVQSMQTICDLISSGPEGDAVLNGFFGPGSSPETGVPLIIAAAEHLCPEHSETIFAYLDDNGLR